jgi:hypothetical protein
VAKLRSPCEVSKLKVDELKACLMFKGVTIPQGSKKADLVELILKEIDLPVDPPPEPQPSSEPDAVGDVGSDGEDGEDGNSGDESGSEEESEDETDLLLS